MIHNKISQTDEKREKVHMSGDMRKPFHEMHPQKNHLPKHTHTHTHTKTDRLPDTFGHAMEK